ncbi:prefoldin subunit 6 protein [Rutstroemia sp. NJR-2017a BVV2]|nr:prefoldin subunit 6 protein [Rutstroemia sp. NJR-2017a BVV2]
MALKARKHFDIPQSGKDYSSRPLLLKSALNLPASTLYQYTEIDQLLHNPAIKPSNLPSKSINLSPPWQKNSNASKLSQSNIPSSKTEFSSLASDSNIYKLVGPVLLKQDKTEAIMAVDGRLEFIEKEIKRVESAIKDIQDKSDGLKMEIIQLQSATQGAQPQAVA